MVEVFSLKSLQALGSVKKGRAATNDDTFLRSSSSGTESVLDAILELTDLNLGGTTNLNNGNTTSKSSRALLKLLLIVVASCVLHGRLNGVNTLLDIFGGTSTTHKDAVILGDEH